MIHTDRDESPQSLVMPPLPEATVRDTLAFDDPEPEPRRGGIVDNAIQGAEGRVGAEAVEREARAVQAFIEAQKTTIGANGYVEVRRTGPQDLPPSERGKLGKIKMSDLKGKSLTDLVAEKWGGGEFAFLVRDARHHVVPGGEFEDDIAGTIKPQSVQGEAWLDRQQSRTTGASRANDDLKGAVDALAEEVRKPKDGGTAGLTDLFAMMMANTEKAAAREREERLERERKDREDREARDRRDREEREQRMEEERERRQDERDRKEKRDKEEREEREERQRRRDKRDEEEAAERREQFALRMKSIEQETTLRLKAMETSAGGGLGLDGLKKVKDFLIESTLDGALGGGGGEEGPGSWTDVVKDVLRKDGGTLVGKFFDTVGNMRNGAAPASVAPPERQLAGPPGLPPVEEPDADVGGGDEQPQADAPAAPNANAALGEMGKRAAAVAAGRVVMFTRVVGSEIMSQGSPEAAWDTPQDEDGTSLADLYEVLALPLKVALRQGWAKYAAAVPESARADVDGISTIVAKHPSAAKWLRAFIMAAPEIEGMPAPVAAPVEPPAPPKPFVPPQAAAPDNPEKPPTKPPEDGKPTFKDGPDGGL